MDNPLLFGFVAVTIFSLMFAMGVNRSFDQLTSLWKQPSLLIRSLLAVTVLVPTVVAVVLSIFHLNPAVMTGLALLAASPGAPLIIKRSEMAGGDPNYSASLQLSLALLAVIITPLTLYIFWNIFGMESRRVGSFEVASQVAEVTFLPVIAGLILQKVTPNFTERIKKPVRVFANVCFAILFTLVITLIVFSPDVRTLLHIGVLPVFAIVLIVGSSLGLGHFLGGPARKQRTTLAVACIARNVGLALFIAQLCDEGGTYIPTILTYMILGVILAFPYSKWSKQSAQV